LLPGNSEEEENRDVLLHQPIPAFRHPLKAQPFASQSVTATGQPLNQRTSQLLNPSRSPRKIFSNRHLPVILVPSSWDLPGSLIPGNQPTISGGKK
jgi:hypothetical protein